MNERAHVLHVDPIRSFEAQDPEEFDRIAFAMQVLDVLRPTKLSVAVYPGYAELRIESIRDLRRGEGARWAFVGIPPRASRAHIAHALADLAGVAQVPYAVDVLLHQCSLESKAPAATAASDDASRADGAAPRADGA